MKFNCCATKKENYDLGETAAFLKVIAEENRLKILCILQKQEMCVCDMWQQLDLPQNLVSHHLKVLKDFDLVKTRREGTKIIYSLNSKTVRRYCALLARNFNFNN